MNHQLRTVISAAGVLLISVPSSMVVTLLLLPFWRWLESHSGVESIGHSGPAEWCYLSVYTLIVLGSFFALWVLQGCRQQDTVGK